jgi:hypothetical protein
MRKNNKRHCLYYTLCSLLKVYAPGCVLSRCDLLLEKWSNEKWKILAKYLIEEDFAMKKTKYTEEQIAFALKQAETGTPVAEVIRKIGHFG